MQPTLCCCCPPCAPAPGAAVDRDDGGGCYEELPVSVPPHVAQGLSRDDDAPLDRWEEGAYAEAVEQLAVPPDHDGEETGSGAGAAGPSSCRLWMACAGGWCLPLSGS